MFILSPELRRHFREFRKAVMQRMYEVAPFGILFPRQQAFIHGEYSFQHNKGGFSPWHSNLMPTEGLDFVLDMIGNDAAAAASYITLHANTTTVLATHTAATYASTFSECSGSEGYDEATRVLWAPAASASAVKNNNASPASFTINTSGTLSVNGVALLTSSTKGGTAGKLLSAIKFGATRSFSDTDLFDVKYQLSLTSS